MQHQETSDLSLNKSLVVSFDSQRDVEMEIKNAQESIKKMMKEQHKKEIEKINENHKKEIEQLAQVNANLKKKFKKATEESESRLADVVSLKTKIELIEKQNQKESIDEIYELNSKLKQSLKENNELKSENSSLKKQLNASVTRVSSLEAKNRTVKESSKEMETKKHEYLQ